MSAEQRLPLWTTLPDGWQVSTMRMPTRDDSGWYESIVIAKTGVAVARRRAETEAQARVNHDELVAKWTVNEESTR